MTTETKILALAEPKERRQVLLEVARGRDGAVQEFEVHQQVGPLNQQQEQAVAKKEGRRGRRVAGPAAPTAAGGCRGLGRRPNSVWSIGSLEEYVRERYGPDDGERPDEIPPDLGGTR